jgi:transposase
MEPQSVHKTFKYKLTPAPAQEQALDSVLSRCRMLYNVALEQHTTWWGRGQGKSATYYQQQAELPDLKAACPEYAEVNAQVLQDVILRVDRAFQAFFRQVQAGEEPGHPRFQGTRAATTASPIRRWARTAVPSLMAGCSLWRKSDVSRSAYIALSRARPRWCR